MHLTFDPDTKRQEKEVLLVRFKNNVNILLFFIILWCVFVPSDEDSQVPD